MKGSLAKLGSVVRHSEGKPCQVRLWSGIVKGSLAKLGSVVRHSGGKPCISGKVKESLAVLTCG